MYHTDGYGVMGSGWGSAGGIGMQLELELKLTEKSRKNSTCMLIRMLTICSING